MLVIFLVFRARVVQGRRVGSNAIVLYMRQKKWKGVAVHGCMLPMLFASFSGLVPPPILPDFPATSVVGMVPPPTDVKGYIWLPSAYYYDTDNFTVQWEDHTIPESFAESVALAAEEAWTQYIDTEGWPLPPTSADYRITIWLDRDLDAPGSAYMYEDLYWGILAPVIYMDPDYVDSGPEYIAVLTHHEVGHTVQYAMRDTSGVEPDAMHTEAWYWEASATWMAERVRPASADCVYTSLHYAENPTAAFDTVDWGHEYGMFLVNAYLDQFVLGWEGIQDIWKTHDGDDWLTVIERHTEEEAALTWAAFAGRYMTRALEHSYAMYYPDLEESPRVVEGHLGAQYLEVTSMESRFEGGTIHLDGGVGTILRDGGMHGVFTDHAEIPWGIGNPILIVTNPSATPLTFSYWLEEPAIDTGLDPDTGDTDTGAHTDTGLDPDTGISTGADGDAGADASGSESGKKGCGWAAAGVISPASWLLALVPLWIRRRSGRHSL